MDIKQLIFGTNWGGYSNPKEGDTLGERLFMALSAGGWITFPLFFAWILASVRYYPTGMNPFGYAFLLSITLEVTLICIHHIRMKQWLSAIYTILLAIFVIYVFFYGVVMQNL